MSRSLPPRSSLQQLQKQAKDVLKAHRAGSASACPTLRHLRRFATASDAEILTADVGLQEAQLALANEYGFADWAELTGRVAAQAAQTAPAEFQLEPSPLIAYDPALSRAPEDIPLPTVLRACMDFVGADMGRITFEAHGRQWVQSEASLLFNFVTGEAFQFIWTPEGPKSFAGAQPDARYRHALDAAGFKATVLVRRGNRPLDAATSYGQLVDSIGIRQMPVIIEGIPTAEDFLLATGYADRGRIMFGWAASGGHNILFEADRRQRVEDWAARAKAVVALKARQEPGDMARTYREAMRRGVSLLRNREAGPYPAGPAAFETWAAAIADPSAAPDQRARLLDPAMWDLAERRAYGSSSLRMAAELLPSASEPLQAAAQCLSTEHDSMWEVSRVMQNLADPAAPGRIAAIILRCRDLDLEASGQIELALSRTGA